MGEVWKKVPGTSGRYEVSDHGRVRRTERVVDRPGQSPMTLKARVLDPGTGDTGYVEVRLQIDGKSRLKRVHRLVLEAFDGPCPDGLEGCHNNGDRTDNRLSNLRWDSRANNLRDREKHGTHPQRNKTVCPRGHLLLDPNLDGHFARQGYRSCKACARARSWAHGHPDRDFRTNADERYAQIMEGAHNG